MMHDRLIGVAPAPRGLPGIVGEGPPRWHALRVAPQREDMAEAWLRLRGVYGFHPVLMRRVRVRGVLRDYARRYLPGYVFARFSGAPVCWRVLECPFILGALTLTGGVWGVLEPDRLRQMHAMRRLDAEGQALRARQAAVRRAQAMVQVGDGALFTGGAFVGQRCEVVDLRGDGGASVRMRLFGSDVLVSAQVADLLRLHKGG